jgi:hypothetical protein
VGKVSIQQDTHADGEGGKPRSIVPYQMLVAPLGVRGRDETRGTAPGGYTNHAALRFLYVTSHLMGSGSSFDDLLCLIRHHGVER